MYGWMYRAGGEEYQTEVFSAVEDEGFGGHIDMGSI